MSDTKEKAKKSLWSKIMGANPNARKRDKNKKEVSDYRKSGGTTDGAVYGKRKNQR